MGVRLKTSLKSEQQEALGILPNNKRFLLCDQTGLGKCLTMLATYEELREKTPKIRMLIIGSKSSLASWEREINKHTTFSYQMIHAQAEPKIKDVDIYVFQYNTTLKFQTIVNYIYNTFDVMLCADEVHKLGNPKSQISILARHMVKNSLYAYGLTATPLTNNIEAFYYIHGSFFPWLLGSYSEFMDRYTQRKLRKTNKVVNGRKHQFYEIVGYKNLEELEQRIKPTMLKRARKYNVIWNTHEFDLSLEEEDLYNKAANGILVLSKTEFVTRLPDLQLVADNAVENDFQESTPDMTLSEVKKSGLKIKENLDKLSSKELQCMQLIASSITKEAVIVFFAFKKSLYRFQSLIQKHGGAFGCKKIHTIIGATSLDERQKVAETLCIGDVVLMTVAGGESLNLQISNRIIFYNLPWDVIHIIQAIGRIARMDSKHETLYVHILEARHTIDTYKKELFLSHADLIESIVGGDSSIPPGIKAASRAAIVRMRKMLLWRRE